MTPPNILVFMTDHQRADTVLSEHPTITPNLTRMAAEGLTFTNAFCPSPHCCPARATFHTGLYPSRHGVWNNICNDQALSRGLNDGVRLWSEDLAEAGYRLKWAGKWHVSVTESPADRGWEEIFVSADGRAHHGQTWDYYRKVAEAPEPTTRGEGEILRPGYGTYRTYGTTGEKTNAHDDAVAAAGIDAIGELASSGKPWAMFLGAIAPHDPYMVPDKYLALYDINDLELPGSYGDEMADKPRVYKRMRDMRWGQLSEREVREAIRHFRAYCTYLDDIFGRVLDALDASGQAGNTLVLYVSDHGDYCGDHGLFAKGIPCFRGAYNVPAVVRWPDGLADPGRRVDALVSLADFAPTFTELAGRSPDPTLTGSSLVPFLRGRTPPGWRDEIHTQCNGVELYYTQRSVTTADYKYVFNGFDDDELYDLRTDPNELVNLVADKAYDPIIREMAGRMWRFAQRENDSAINAYITVSLAPYGPGQAFSKD